jgi:hypothetical protein
MQTEVSTVQLMVDGDGAHSTFAASLLDAPGNVALRAEEKFVASPAVAGARAAILHTNVFIRLAVFHEH